MYSRTVCTLFIGVLALLLDQSAAAPFFLPEARAAEAEEATHTPDSYAVNRIASATFKGGRTIAVEVHRRWSFPDWLGHEYLGRGDSVVVSIMEKDNHDSRWEIVAIPPLRIPPHTDGQVVSVEAIHADSVVLLDCDDTYRIYCNSTKVFFDADARKLLGHVRMKPIGESALLQFNNSIYAITRRLWNSRNWHEAIVARYSPGEPMLVTGAERSRVIAGLPRPPGDCEDPEESPILEGGLLHPSVTPLTRPSCFVQIASAPLLWTFGFRLGNYTPGGKFEFLSGIAMQSGDSFVAYPLAQSTLEELGTYRPIFRKYPKAIDSYRMNESIEAFPARGDRVWFGKSFYDGEGYTGVGSLGYFDIGRRSYELIRIPEIADWSASAILIEGESIWVALAHYTEGADSSGGLLRYDTNTGETRIHPISDVITDILSHNGTIYATTERGRTYVLKEDSIVSRHALEPALEGGFEIRSFSSTQ